MAEAKSYQEAAAEMQGHMQFVATQIGDDWRWLARKLKVDECVINNVDVDFKGTEEKAYQILMKWYQYYGKVIATIETLIKALYDVRKTSIAEELEQRIGWKLNVEKKPVVSKETPEEHKRHEDNKSTENHKSTEESRTPPRGYEMTLEKLGKELEEMFKNCIDNCVDNIEILNCSALLHNQKILQRLQTLNTILKESIESRENSDEDRTSMEEIHKSFRTRQQQTEEAILLIQGRIQDPCMGNKVPINPKKGKAKKQRPISDIPQRCTSEVNLQELVRSKTDGSTLFKDKRKISSPILTIKHSVMCREFSCGESPPMPTCEETSEETKRDKVFTKMLQTTSCETCGHPCMSNFQAEKFPGNASEHEQASLNENLNQESAGTDAFEEKQVSLDQNCNQISKPVPHNPEIDEKEPENTRL